MSDMQIVAPKSTTHVISSKFPDARFWGKKRHLVFGKSKK